MDEKSKNIPDIESDVERINSFVSSSEPVNEEPVAHDMEAEESVSEPKEEKPIEPVREAPIEKVVKPKPAQTQDKVHEEAKHPKIHIEKKQVELAHKPKIETREPKEKIIKVSKPAQKVVQKTEKPEVKKVVHKAVHEKIVEKKTENKTIKPETKKIVKVSKVNSVKDKKPLREDNMAKEHKKKFKVTKNTWTWIGIGVLAAILVIALILYIPSILSPKQQPAAPANETAKTVAATVNGEAIYLQDVVNEYNSLDSLTKSMYTVDSVLNKTIGEVLLYQEAKNSGIKIAAEDIQAQIDALKIQNNLTDSDLNSALQKQGITLDDLKNLITKNLAIRAYLNSTILNNITVTDGEIKDYYDQNMNQYKVPEKVTVQHILIAFGPNTTENDTKAKIEQVNSELNSTNFCDLVTKYSQDPGSISTCGTYTFGKGEMVPEFENPSFDMKVNETTIVRTVYGYHLIKKLASVPSYIMNLSDVYAQINQTVYGQIAQKNFDELVASLKDKAVIVNYMAKTDSNASSVTTVPKSLDDFAKCLTDKGVKFYGASWCPHCENQKTMFGSSLQYVTYVECADANNPQVQTPECNAAGITGYPTWIVNNQSYPGEQTLDGLAKMTGCVLPQ